MKKGVQINLTNRWMYTLITILIISIISVGVYAFSGNVGHTSDQIDELDPTVIASVKDGITWGEIPDRPSGLDSNFPTCNGTQKLTFDGTSLTCANDANSQRSTASGVYLVNPRCDAKSLLSLSSTCKTILCGSGGYYYRCNTNTCSGTRVETCSNTFVGNLVN